MAGPAGAISIVGALAQETDRIALRSMGRKRLPKI